MRRTCHWRRAPSAEAGNSEHSVIFAQGRCRSARSGRQGGAGCGRATRPGHGGTSQRTRSCRLRGDESLCDRHHRQAAILTIPKVGRAGLPPCRRSHLVPWRAGDPIHCSTVSDMAAEIPGTAARTCAGPTIPGGIGGGDSAGSTTGCGQYRRCCAGGGHAPGRLCAESRRTVRPGRLSACAKPLAIC